MIDTQNDPTSRGAGEGAVVVEGPTGGPRFALIAAVAIAVIVALMVAVLATRDPSTERASQSPLIGELAPAAAGTTIDGEEVSIDDHRGRWVMLNFFGSWCTPCLEEHPELNAFDVAHQAEGDAVLMSVTFDDKADKAREFFDEHGGDWPVIDDPENSIGVAYGVAQVPETFVIAPNGVVVQRFAGAVTRAELDEVIARYEDPVGTGDDPTAEQTESAP
jgi:cytochrome c biogenesis protein CcmG/thiol:disulfide interchange protein DsbE